MKKILCGALVLLAAVVAFSGCKKKDNSGSSEGAEFAITPAIVELAPGNTQRVKLTISDVTATWTSDDETVATVDKYGTITAKAKGETTVKATEKGGTRVATCTVKVLDPLALVIFNQASVSYSYSSTTHKPLPEEVYGDTIVAAVTNKNQIGEEEIVGGDTIWAVMIAANLNLFSKGLGYDDDGNLTGADDGYIMSCPTFLYYSDYDMVRNSQARYVGSDGKVHYFLEQGKHYVWDRAKDAQRKNPYMVEIPDSGEKLARKVIPGSLSNEDAFMTYIKKAIAAANNAEWNTEDGFWVNQFHADTASIDGASVTYYFYNENIGEYDFASYLPDALVTNLTAVIEDNPSSNYMFTVSGMRAELKPVHIATVGEMLVPMGVDVQTDELTEAMTIVSGDKPVLDEAINLEYYSNTTSAPARKVAAEDDEMMILTAEDIEQIKSQKFINTLDMPRAKKILRK